MRQCARYAHESLAKLIRSSSRLPISPRLPLFAFRLEMWNAASRCYLHNSLCRIILKRHLARLVIYIWRMPFMNTVENIHAEALRCPILSGIGVQVLHRQLFWREVERRGYQALARICCGTSKIYDCIKSRHSALHFVLQVVAFAQVLPFFLSPTSSVIGSDQVHVSWFTRTRKRAPGEPF